MKFETKAAVLFNSFILAVLACSANAYETKTHRFLACEALRSTQLELPSAYAEFAQNARCDDCTTLHACSGFSLRDAEELQSRLHSRLDSEDEWNPLKFCDFESAIYDPPAYYPYGSRAYFYEGDDLVNGISDEDSYNEHDPRTNLIIPSFANHFWDPDVVSSENSGDFDGGLPLALSGTKQFLVETCQLADQPECQVRQSNYHRALSLWDRAIALYKSGDKRQAYYTLGRVTHLIADLTVPAHVHRDQHSGVPLSKLFIQTCCGGVTHSDNQADIVEKTAKASSLLKELRDVVYFVPYQFEALPIELDWSRFGDHGVSKLFRLFWFTAQKTQYWAGLADAKPGKHESFSRRDCEAGEPDTAAICVEYSEGELGKPNIYFDKDSNADYLPENLWNDVDEVLGRPCEVRFAKSSDIKSMTKALLAHALHATSGLYRLFWDATHDVDGDGYGVVTDCDDTNSLVFPGNTEICSDALDNDCDGVVNNGCLSFTITHNPRVDAHPHFFSDIQIGGTEGISTPTVISVSSPEGFVGDVTLRVVGISLDRLPDNPDGDTYGDGLPDDPLYSILPSTMIWSIFDGYGAISKTIPVGGSTEFRVRKLRSVLPGRYLLKMEGTSGEVAAHSEILLVIGEGEPGYIPR